MGEDLKPLVFDNGTGIFKAGFGGEDQPRVVISTIVGSPKHTNIMDMMIEKSHYIGYEVQFTNKLLTIKRPIENGVIRNWDDMEKIWHYAFYRTLKVDPEEHPVILTEAPLTPRHIRETMTQIMLETFSVGKINIQISSVLALYACNKTTGVVVDMGFDQTFVVPIYDGYNLPHATARFGIGGKTLTDYLIKLLQEKQICFESFREKQDLNSMKENFCYVAQDFEKEMKKYQEYKAPFKKKYKLLDQQIISIGKERFLTTEPIFEPSLVGIESKSLPKLTLNTINKCDSEYRNHLAGSILISGGSSLFKGLSDRFEKEIWESNKSNLKINLIHERKRQFLTWLGGSILSQLSEFKKLYLTKEEYNESGIFYSRRKIF
ncbi:actin-7-related [Anaeramoeba flamelloides]|uniref:Actin-7-related n=1 Tax=Anaeramoeba flamelloides TaxID=1746091 RepID=A0ABQ8X9D8_9EUKA|nr:actin-7-related [Anaeramoeba flamelloides]